MSTQRSRNDIIETESETEVKESADLAFGLRDTGQRATLPPTISSDIFAFPVQDGNTFNSSEKVDEESGLDRMKDNVSEAAKIMINDMKSFENDAKQKKAQPISEHKVEEVFQLPSDLLVADIAALPSTKLNDLAPSSPWKTGPNFLCSWRELWLVTRDQRDFVKVGFLDAVLRVLQYS